MAAVLYAVVKENGDIVSQLLNYMTEVNTTDTV